MRVFRLLIQLIVLLTIMNYGCSSMAPKNVHEINSNYYQIQNTDLISVSCDVSADKLNEMIDSIIKGLPLDKQRIVDNNIKLHANISKTHNIKVNHSGDIKIKNMPIYADLGASIGGIESIIDSFLKIWLEFTFKPIFETGDSNYKIEKNFNYYLISFSKSSMNITAKLSRNYEIIEARGVNNEGKHSIRANFKSTTKGFLIKQYFMAKENDDFSYGFTVNYKEIEGYYFPEEVLIDNIFNEEIQNIKLNFHNYKILKEQ